MIKLNKVEGRKLLVWYSLEFIRAELLVDNLPDDLVGRHIGK
jgi:hypothetical protein